jgi:hypothetical protein
MAGRDEMAEMEKSERSHGWRSRGAEWTGNSSQKMSAGCSSRLGRRSCAQGGLRPSDLGPGARHWEGEGARRLGKERRKEDARELSDPLEKTA